MRRTVLWDSGAILALIDGKDADHAAAKRVAVDIAKHKRPSFITNYTLAETHALLLSKLGRAIAREWLLSASLPVVHVTRHEEERAQEILATYDDKDFSFCDAVCFAVMEKRSVSTAFAFDEHFRQYGRFTIVGPE